MHKQNTERGLAATTTITIGIALAIGLVTAWCGSPFFAQPFADRSAIKVMAALAALIVWFGGMGATFLQGRHTKVAIWCAGALALTYAIGLVVAHF